MREAFKKLTPRLLATAFRTLSISQLQISLNYNSEYSEINYISISRIKFLELRGIADAGTYWHTKTIMNYTFTSC